MVERPQITRAATEPSVRQRAFNYLRKFRPSLPALPSQSSSVNCSTASLPFTLAPELARVYSASAIPRTLAPVQVACYHALTTPVDSSAAAQRKRRMETEVTIQVRLEGYRHPGHSPYVGANGAWEPGEGDSIDNLRVKALVDGRVVDITDAIDSEQLATLEEEFCEHERNADDNYF